MPAYFHIRYLAIVQLGCGCEDRISSFRRPDADDRIQVYMYGSSHSQKMCLRWHTWDMAFIVLSQVVLEVFLMMRGLFGVCLPSQFDRLTRTFSLCTLLSEQIGPRCTRCGFCGRTSIRVLCGAIYT